MFLIAPLVAISQNSSTTIEIEVLRKAAILISEGDECKEASVLKDAQIKELHYQVDHLTDITSVQDSIIFRKSSIISNQDLIILTQEDWIEIKDKEIKKQKRKTKLVIIGSIVLDVLIIAIAL